MICRPEARENWIIKCSFQLIILELKYLKSRKTHSVPINTLRNPYEIDLFYIRFSFFKEIKIIEISLKFSFLKIFAGVPIILF